MKPILAIAGLCLSTPAAFGQLSFTDLGTLGTQMPPLRVSDDGGVVVGNYNPPGAATRAFIWTPSGGIGSFGDLRTTVLGMSTNGEHVVGFLLVDGSRTQAAKWDLSGNVTLLVDSDAVPVSRAEYVSDDGEIVFGNFGGSLSMRHFVWTPQGSASEIARPAGVSYLYPAGAAADGAEAMYIAYTADARTLMRWTAESGLVDAGFVSPAVWWHAAASFGGAGSVVGHVMTENSSSTTGWVYWVPGAAAERINGVEVLSCISGDGLVCAGTARLNSESSRTVLWTPETGAIDLVGYLTAAGIDLSAWDSFAPAALNSDGSILLLKGRLSGRWHTALVRGLDVRSRSACAADVGRSGGFAGGDGELDNNDFIAFLDLFFSRSMRTDLADVEGNPVPDGMLGATDVARFIDLFMEGC